MKRTQTKQIHVGPVAIGGGAPVAVQSMCNTHTSDARATIEQIARLHDAGCEIIRLAVPDQAAADALPEIVHASPIPVVGACSKSTVTRRRRRSSRVRRGTLTCCTGMILTTSPCR